jgi:uncharacterized membrane protein (UPF0127 family)
MKNNSIILATIVSIFIITISCSEDSVNSVNNRKVDTVEIKFKKQAELKVLDSINNVIANFDVELATNSYERETGLMYRKEMKPKQAMLFVFDREKPLGFYMKNTYISLDIIYINANNKIVHIAKNAVPLDETTISSRYPAQYVLEVNAGVTNRLQIKAGNTIEWKKI